VKNEDGDADRMVSYRSRGDETMRKPSLLLLLLLPVLLAAGRTVNPPPPVAVADAAGVWVGVDEDYSGVYRLEIRDGGSAVLAYTSSHPDETEVDLYRIDDWQQNRENVKPQAKPLSDDAMEVKISGKVTRSAILLKVNRRGGVEHRIRLVREEQIEAAMRRARESLVGLE
jgi:hypothetical protein